MTADAIPTESEPPRRPRRRINLHVLGPLLALAALVILGASLNDNFLSAGNVQNVLARSAFIGIIAVGMTFVITAGGIDLSVGSMSAFTAGVTILAPACGSSRSSSRSARWASIAR